MDIFNQTKIVIFQIILPLKVIIPEVKDKATIFHHLEVKPEFITGKINHRVFYRYMMTIPLETLALIKL